jgi:hypothetical protein
MGQAERHVSDEHQPVRIQHLDGVNSQRREKAGKPFLRAKGRCRLKDRGLELALSEHEAGGRLLRSHRREYTHMYVCMYACMHGWMHGWMDAWMDGWMHACMQCMLSDWITRFLLFYHLGQSGKGLPTYLPPTQPQGSKRSVQASKQADCVGVGDNRLSSTACLLSIYTYWIGFAGPIHTYRARLRPMLSLQLLLLLRSFCQNPRRLGIKLMENWAHATAAASYCFYCLLLLLLLLLLLMVFALHCIVALDLLLASNRRKHEVPHPSIQWAVSC